jgi:hypothetical protein
VLLLALRLAFESSVAEDSHLHRAACRARAQGLGECFLREYIDKDDQQQQQQEQLQQEQLQQQQQQQQEEQQRPPLKFGVKGKCLPMP